MATTIGAREFDRLREFLERETSISLGNDKAYLVETRLSEIMSAQGIGDYGALLVALQGDRPRGVRDLVIDAMTTNETLWFRDGAPFDLFRDHFLPAWAGEIAAGTRQKIRIWSAACSSGQEPYSLAMTYSDVARRFPALRPECLEIVATDLSDSALASARSGSYGGLALQRGLPEGCLERHFTPAADGRYVVRREVRDRVSFRKFNLKDSFITLGTFDMVLARYVLIYFQDEFKREVLRKAHGALDRGGALFLGSSESLPAGVPGFALVRRGRVTWYQKSEVAARRAPGEAVASAPVPVPAPVPAPAAAPKPAAPDGDMAALLKRLQDLNAQHSK